MKKDFSQPFERGKTLVTLIVRSANQYFLIRSTNSYEKGWFSILSTELEPGQDELLQIVKYLESQGFSATELRELATTRGIAYSFADKTPGHYTTHRCIVVDVDVHDKLPKPAPKAEEERLFVSLKDYIAAYENPDSPLRINELTSALLHLEAES